MIIFYSTTIENNNLLLIEEEHNHCSKVLRKQKNDEIKVTDGKGNLYSCVISEIAKSNTICQITDVKVYEKPESYLAIGITPTKNPSRLEWFIEKATEIGISEIIIFQAQRTEKKSLNKGRLEKILISAMKQSLNLYLPKIKIINKFQEISECCTGFNFKYIAYCDGPVQLLSEVFDKKGSGIVLIGPEGDFTPDEIKYAQNLDFVPISLGKTRLRTETAGLVALMMMRY
jgi:16S rRNA (uracil1498-N3)-methyltransferase